MRSDLARRPMRAGGTAGIIACLLAAAGCGGPKAGNLSSSQPAKAEPAAEALAAVRTGELREQAIALLLHAAQSPHPEVRANAVEGLALTPARLKPILPAVLSDDNLGVRAVGAMAVGKARLTGSLAHVRPLVYDREPIVKAAAVFALRRCGDTGPDADPTPIGALLWDDSPSTRAHGAYLLGELRDPSALPMLNDSLRLRLARAPQAELRTLELQIAEARVKLGDESALHPIRAALYPSRPDDLEATALAAQIIGEVNDRRSIDQLVYLTARLDETGRLMPPEVRLAAAASLAKLGLPRGAFLAEEFLSDPGPGIRAQAALLLGAIGHEDGLKHLRGLLEDPDPRVRVAAAAAILRITERGQPAR